MPSEAQGGGTGESEVSFREIVENIPQVFYVTDPSGRVLYVSPALEAISGYSVDRLRESPRAWIDFAHPDDRARVAGVIAENRGKGRIELEYRVLHHNGAVRWLRACMVEVRGPGGNVERIVGTATDITQQRELEQQLRQAQKMEAIGQLAGGIAHDFNNLLTVVVANARMLRERARADQDAARQAFEIEEAAQRAAELTKKLLGLSRQAVLTRRPVSLADIVREVAILLRHTFDPRIEVRVTVGEGGDIVRADQTEMVHVLMNLCLNARDAMPDGGRLTLETGRTVVDAAHAARATGGNAGTYVYVSVVDTGGGIPEEVVPRIFEPFFTTKPVGKGTGLGLAVAFGIVRQHEGFIECTTTPGEGTRFTIFLPPHEGRGGVVPAGPAVATSSSVTAAARGRETILFVDDEETIRSLARRILEGQGYRVRVAGDGEDAVAEFRSDPHGVDLVVVDLTMPRLTGMEVAQRLRRIRPDVRILLSTGHIGEETRAVERDPTIRLLPKPYLPDALLAAVRRALDRP